MNNILFVVDMQTCFLNFYKNRDYVKNGIDSVNRSIHAARTKGSEIIFIEHEYKNPVLRLLASLFFKGAGIQTKPGFATDPGVRFEKTDKKYLKFEGDLFSVPEILERFRKGYDGRVIIVGQDGNACIKDSARGAIKLGLKASVVESSVLAINIDKWDVEKKKLQSLGVAILPGTE